jgi:hypothetical protein
MGIVVALIPSPLQQIAELPPASARPSPRPSPAQPEGCMFTVDEATAQAIRRAYDEGGELSGIVEFRRHFPLITDNAKAGECVRIIAGWQPGPDRKPKAARPARARRRA